MGLDRSYHHIAPFYDRFVAGWSRPARKASLAAIDPARHRRILVAGAGSGLDLPHIPTGPRLFVSDLTPAMLLRGRRREPSARFQVADVHRLPYRDGAFDAVVLHLILAVVPRSAVALAEAERVLAPGGRILVLDKFLRPGERAPLRRLVSPLLGRFATRTDVVFEELLPSAPSLVVVEDVPAFGKGWFRRIVLEKEGCPGDRRPQIPQTPSG